LVLEIWCLSETTGEDSRYISGEILVIHLNPKPEVKLGSFGNQS